MNIKITVKPINKKSYNCYAGRKIIGKIHKVDKVDKVGKEYVAMTGLNRLRKIGSFPTLELAMYGVAHDEGYIAHEEDITK